MRAQRTSENGRQARAPMRWAAAVLALGLLAGCATAPLPPEPNDPYESTNRAWFDTNLRLSGAFGDEDGRAAGEDGAEAPRRHPIRRLVSNFGANLGLPSTILNDLLQLNGAHAAENTLRLVVNTTVGLGGLFDPASHMGLHGRSSDFGETLHFWGVGEGAYVVLPLLGPSTERDALGMVVDLALDPLRFVLPRDEFGWSLAARAGARLADAAEYADLLEANVINTADPYAQARLLYLQTRRYHLGVEAEDEIIDPYADF